MGVGERTAMEGPKQHFIGDASDVKEMKTRLQPVVCWFWGFNGFNRFSHLFECPFFQRTLMHTEIAWPMSLWPLSYLSISLSPKKTGLASRQNPKHFSWSALWPRPRQCSKGWSWSGRGHRPLAFSIGEGELVTGELVTRPASSWNSGCDEDYNICITMYYLRTVQILGRHNDAKVYWKLSEMCSQCMNSTGSRSVRLWISFLQPRLAQQVGGTGNEGKGQILSIFPPCLCTGNMQNMVQICSKSHVSPGKPWKKGNFDRFASRVMSPDVTLVSRNHWYNSILLQIWDVWNMLSFEGSRHCLPSARSPTYVETANTVTGVAFFSQLVIAEARSVYRSRSSKTPASFCSFTHRHKSIETWDVVMSTPGKRAIGLDPRKTCWRCLYIPFRSSWKRTSKTQVQQIPTISPLNHHESCKNGGAPSQPTAAQTWGARA